MAGADEVTFPSDAHPEAAPEASGAELRAFTDGGRSLKAVQTGSEQPSEVK